jgi:hypothetical protein
MCGMCDYQGTRSMCSERKTLVYVCMYVCICVCVVCVWVHVCMFVGKCVCMSGNNNDVIGAQDACVCTHVCVCTYVCVYL